MTVPALLPRSGVDCCIIALNMRVISSKCRKCQNTSAFFSRVSRYNVFLPYSPSPFPLRMGKQQRIPRPFMDASRDAFILPVERTLTRNFFSDR
jgi:hypothetical protein